MLFQYRGKKVIYHYYFIDDDNADGDDDKYDDDNDVFKDIDEMAQNAKLVITSTTYFRFTTAAK